jgi:hypothetical protein
MLPFKPVAAIVERLPPSLSLLRLGLMVEIACLAD